MWALRVNNDPSPIEFDGSIAMVLNSPVFFDQISYSLQFSVKWTLKNAKKFGFINKPEIADNKSRELPFSIEAGVMILPGTVVVVYQGYAYNCYFKLTGDFWSAIKDKSLKDIAWDKITFPDNTGYAEIIDFVHQYQESFDNDFTFPVIVNKTVVDKFPVKANCLDFVNTPIDQTANICPIIPFMYLRTIYESIFRKNGILINQSVFSESFMKKLCLPNNFIINEFELDKTVIWSGLSFIIHITNEMNPVVTTVTPHGIENYGFIKIGLIPGMPIDGNIYQVEKINETITNDDGSTSEVISDVSFKLLNADFSAYPEYVRNYYKATEIVKGSNAYGRYIKLVPDPEKPIKELTAGDGWFYIRSDDWNFKPGFLQGDSYGNLYVYPENSDSRPLETHYDEHSYANAIIIPMAQFGSAGYYEGLLQKLPSALINKFISINPANHVPNITITDFLNQCKWMFGLVSFVKSSGVDIKSFKDVLSASGFIDMSDFSKLMSDISNPDLNGYLLQMTADDTDTYYKSKLPVQSIDAKYQLKDAVMQIGSSQSLDMPPISFLPSDAETNDVRLVLYEHLFQDTQICNSFYIYNKSILSDSSWKFLCFNLLDLISGKGDLKIQTKFSTLLKNNEIFYKYRIEPSTNIVNELYLQHDINCKCKTFDNDVSSLKVIIYHGIRITDIVANIPVGTRIVYSSNDIFDEKMNIIPDAEFALRWDGDHGLYEKVWKEYIDWQLNVRKDCISEIQWPIALLADFDFSKKYRIRGIDYLVKDIKFTLNFKTQRIEFNETELAKV